VEVAEQLPSARELAAQIRERIGLSSPRGRVKFSGGAFALIAYHAQFGDTGWPYRVTTAVEGIKDAVATGRLPGRVVEWLRDLSDWRWCNLVALVATRCRVMAEVPQYLIDLHRDGGLDRAWRRAA